MLGLGLGLELDHRGIPRLSGLSARSSSSARHIRRSSSPRCRRHPNPNPNTNPNPNPNANTNPNPNTNTNPDADPDPNQYLSTNIGRYQKEILRLRDQLGKGGGAQAQ